jgi:putative aminopeptidase FrvX
MEGCLMKENLIANLENLFHIYSPFQKEQEMTLFTEDFLRECSFNVTKDDIGNIMAYRGKADNLPLLNAHMDTRQNESDRPHLEKISYIPDEDKFQLKNVQIGCDDKAGIGIILTLAKYTNLEFKVLLTVQEEYDQLGVRNIPKEFYNNVCWAFSLDRKGSSDIITVYGEKPMCSDEFLKELISISSEEGVYLSENGGSMADTYYISKYCPAVNLSVGYYKPHQKNDYLKVDETYNILRVVKRCMENKQRLSNK